MVCRGTVLPAIGILLSLGTVEAGFDVRRVIVDAALTPGANEIQEVGPERRVMQTFTPPSEPIAGVELFASRYPRCESLDLMIRVRQGDCDLGMGRVAIPSLVPMRVRLVFPPVRVEGVVTIEAWAPDARPGHAAGIQFYPIDHYRGGELRVAGRLVRGDAAFRVLSPETSMAWMVTGLDLSTVRDRFPSDNLVEAGELRQEFLVPLERLVGVEFTTGTGGRPVGPPLVWALELNGRAVRSGTVDGVGDNVPLRLTFAPLVGSEGLPLTLRVWTTKRAGELRLWLRGRAPGMGSLTIGDYPIDASLALTTLHLAAPTDSMLVVFSLEKPPEPEAAVVLTEDCQIVQTFRWPGPRTRSDLIGFRSAHGQMLVPSALAYEVRDETGAVVHRDSVGLGGTGSDDFLWMGLGSPGEGERMSVMVGGVGAKAETAARFWWMPGDVYRDGEATGCVPRPGGDCVFRLARTYGWWEWLVQFPEVAGDLAPRGWKGALNWLLATRLVVLAASVAAAMCRISGRAR